MPSSTTPARSHESRARGSSLSSRPTRTGSEPSLHPRLSSSSIPGVMESRRSTKARHCAPRESRVRFSSSCRRALLHVANSAAALRGKQFAFDLVRPGIFLYGGAPAEHLMRPRPVVSVRARVLSVRRIRKGESVSYGASWIAPRDTVVATLGIGYADGVRRGVAVSGKAHVLLRGQRCPIAGLVQMDLTIVDTGTLEVQVGDVATIVGEDTKQQITLEELSAWSGAIVHEVLAGLGSRLPRVPV